MPPTSPRPLHQALLSHLTSKHLLPTSTWLTTFLSTQRTDIQLPALQKTALFRLQTSDITTTLSAPSASSTFPADILDARIQSRILSDPITVQVLEVEDVGRSRWSQIEAIESAERGETTKGREVVRVVPSEENGDADALDATSASGSAGPFKLLLQDIKGTRVYAFGMERIDGVNGGMPIGTKMVLRNAVVARGVVMLEVGSVSVLGGKIEGLDKMWREKRKERLKEGIENTNAG